MDGYGKFDTDEGADDRRRERMAGILEQLRSKRTRNTMQDLEQARARTGMPHVGWDPHGPSSYFKERYESVAEHPLPPEDPEQREAVMRNLERQLEAMRERKRRSMDVGY